MKMHLYIILLLSVENNKISIFDLIFIMIYKTDKYRDLRY